MEVANIINILSEKKEWSTTEIAMRARINMIYLTGYLSALESLGLIKSKIIGQDDVGGPTKRIWWLTHDKDATLEKINQIKA
jgi:predicted transcriptional regulator